MIDLRIDASALEKLARDLSRIEKQIPQEIARGVNEGGDKVRTAVRHALQDQTSLLKYSSVVQRTRSTRAYGTAPVYTIYVAGTPTKITEFKTSAASGPGGGVTAILWQKAHTFARSFQQKYRGGLRARLGGTRLPIRPLDGPNLAKEAVKDESAKTFLETANTVVTPIVMKRLLRLFA